MMRRFRVGEVLRLERRPVEIAPTDDYVSIGIRSFGKGIFHYPPTPGAELSKLRFFEVRPDDLVVSNIKAWEGAIAVASESEAGCIESNRFLSYVPVDGAIDVRYACYFFLSEAGLPLIQHASPGSADRNRTLAIDRFENLEISLPELAEQRRIVARLEELLDAISSAIELIARATTLDSALTDSAVDAILADNSKADWLNLPLSEVAIVNPPPSSVAGSVAFVPMSAIDEKLGKIADPEIRPIEDIKSGYKQFRRGDVIFARITPCMQNGKCAVVEIEGVEYGYGSTEFHVLRPSETLLPRWLHRVVRSHGFRERAMRSFKGTAGQQRVPASFLEQVRIPVPPIEDQHRLVARIDRVLGLGNEVRRRRELQLERAKALSSSVLNRAFTDLL